MKEPEPGMTQVEFLDSLIPEGKLCWGCDNIEDGKCATWKHKVTNKTPKCEWCLRNQYLRQARKMKESLDTAK